LTFPVTLRAAARPEFDEAFDWYEARQAGLGVWFAAQVHAVLDTIAERPELYPRVLGDIRRAVVRRTPYVIFYRVRPHRISVLAVFHSSRDPRVWQSRR
jgi:plasmid stabilization system protein ParE